MKFFALLILFSFIFFYDIYAQDYSESDKRANTSIPYTLADRDRMIKLESDLKSLRTEMNVRFESIDARFENLFSLTLWGFGILFAGMISIVGFVLWDRRSTMKPIELKNKEIEEENKNIKEQNRKIIEILKDIAGENGNLKNLMNKAALI